MRSTSRVLTLLLLAFSVSVFSQGKIQGKIVDATTSEALPFANVFLNNTTLGTNADDLGNFELKNIPRGEYELIVSYVGHQNHQSKIIIKDTARLSIVIRLSAVALKDVEIVGKRDQEWDKQLEKFKKLFLGYAGKSEEVRIVNPYGLEFNESDGNFSAASSETLRLENYHLGYYVSYSLRSFIVTPSAYSINGTALFSEMSTTDSKLIRKWNDNRREAYEGSARHLFKSIIDGQFNTSGFELFTQIHQNKFPTTNVFYQNLDKTVSKYVPENILEYDSKQDLYRLKLPGKIEVHYNNKGAPNKYYKDVAHPVSWIESASPYLTMTRDGVLLNSLDMIVSGDMTYSRIAELLPRDYRPDIVPENKAPAKSKINPYFYFLEKPYVHTDRSCYYNNDDIWFKIYMNYVNPWSRDSLSHVAYVELVDPSKKVVVVRTIQLTGGTGDGFINVPSALPKGNYQLRAYTRWMLNYNRELIFAKPLTILAPDEIVVSAPDARIDTAKNDRLLVRTNKSVYSPREKITLMIKTMDFFHNNLPANLSVSVTDVLQAAPARNESNILMSLPWTEKDSLALPTLATFKLQDGIDINGKFINRKGKADEGIVSAMRKNSPEAFAVPTNKTGEFLIENLQFFDSVEFGIQGRSMADQKPGTVIIDTTQTSPEVRPIDKLDVKVESAKNYRGLGRWSPSASEEVRTLKEVVVEANKISDQKTSIKKMANYTITGEWLRAINANIPVALQGRVPGFHIYTFLNGTALPYQVVILEGRHVSFLRGQGQTKETQLQVLEPLILINDVVVNYQLGDGALAISRLRPEEIERIDVYRSNGYGNFGTRGGSGVISIYTKHPMDYVKPGNFGESGFKLVTISGFSRGKNFESPVYDRTDTTNTGADYRSTIYWNPVVNTNGQAETTLEFFAADNATQYRIVVEGVTAEAVPVRAEKIIEVKK